KPLGLSPKGIEFKRAHLYDINPVGVGAMALASLLSVTAHLGFFGPMAQAFSALIALATALITSPMIAFATRGKYYLARAATPMPCHAQAGQRVRLQRCVICERDYEGPDMAHCPAYQGPICSLCCTLDARCGDLCKPHASLATQWSATLHWLLPRRSWALLDKGLAYFLLLMLVIAPLLGSVFGLLYLQETEALAQSLFDDPVLQIGQAALGSGFLKAYMALLLIAGLVAWWVVLAHQSRRVAQDESNRQTSLLLREIELHRQTDAALQQAKQAADRANQAKSRYISAISHELRTPLNSILGYAQLMGQDTGIPAHRKQAVAVIKRGGEHLLSLIEGTLDLAHIETGRLTLNPKPLAFADFMQDLADMFELEAERKALRFVFEVQGKLPAMVRADEKRVRQILLNLLGNAIKFTSSGQVSLRLRYAIEMAHIEVEDTGPGLSEQDLAHVFEPFARANAPGQGAPGAGMGLTIARMLTDLMGGELSVSSLPGVGSVFKVKLFLPEIHTSLPAREGADTKACRPAAAPVKPRMAYAGPRQRVLVVDNEEADRELLVHLLQPLGFEVRTAASGHDALDLLASGYQPHAMFMDLAMPGIDGWETVRRVRVLEQATQRPYAQIAIVSANAFDRGLDNAVGLPSDDFFCKPVRHADLLDWLTQRLGLVWQEAVEPSAPALVAVDANALGYPDRTQLDALQEVVTLGFYRGILNQLDAMEAAQPECAQFVASMRELARQFQFETMGQQLARLEHEH
ncbi:MAG: hypothetical protein RLZZ371_1464, partial [Pseudomonadota bacterium]